MKKYLSIVIITILISSVSIYGKQKQQVTVNNKKIKTTKVVSAQYVPHAVNVVVRKNSFLHVLSNIPKTAVNVLRVFTDTGEYITDKVHQGFVKLDEAADEYAEGQTQ